MTAVIENTAGQGSNLGFSFEQLAAMIDGVEDKSRVKQTPAMPLPPVTICAVPMAVKKCLPTSKELSALTTSAVCTSTTPARSIPAGLIATTAWAGNLGLNVFQFIMQDSRFDGIPGAGDH